ncbi:MAG: Lrp/AsnC family transcriptional regulator [Rhodospirillaceae bacterium]|nr:Lrp/AsnC family transcriptional regulator [Rhodospirillaceae bacterium]
MPDANLKLSVASVSAAPSEGERFALDEIDRTILRLLQDDGRRQYGSIARELGVSDGTVRNRIMQMLDAGVFRIFAVADPVKLGYEGYAMLLIRLAAGADPDEVGAHFQNLSNVTFVTSTAGQYSLLVEVVVESPQALHDFLRLQCHSRKDIAQVEPLIGLKMYKNAVQWSIPAASSRGA